MKVLFLDIDGVLNSRKFFTSKEWLVNSMNPTSQIDPKAVEILNRIVFKTECVVVVSSTWRLYHSYDKIAKMLEAKGYNHSNIIGQTPDLAQYDKNRADEISMWLACNKQVDAYAILDDEQVFVGPRMVRTDSNIGLVESDVDNVVNALYEFLG